MSLNHPDLKLAEGPHPTQQSLRAYAEDECQNIPKSRCSKLLASQSRRLEAVITFLLSNEFTKQFLKILFFSPPSSFWSKGEIV